MRISAVIGMPMGVGLTVLADPIMNVLYPNSNEAGPGLLAVMGIASFFVCVVLMENAILQASGKEKFTMITMIVGGLVKILVNWLLVAQRQINIYGAPIGTLVSYITMTVLNFVFMCAVLDERPHLLRIFARPLISSLAMGASAWAVYGLAYRLRLEADGGEHAARGHCRGGDLRRVRRGAARGNERGYEAHPRRRKDSKTAAYPLSAGIAKKL